MSKGLEICTCKLCSWKCFARVQLCFHYDSSFLQTKEIVKADKLLTVIRDICDLSVWFIENNYASIDVAVRQYADICLFSTAQYKCPVAEVESE